MNIDKNATMLDVRTPEEFAGQHVPGAINIPLDQVMSRLNEIKIMSTPVIVYCKTGNRSGIAVDLMKQNGIMNVVNGGGMNDIIDSKTTAI